MILQALNNLYERLEEDPNTSIAPMGYSPQKIVGSIVIDNNGNLDQFFPEYREEGKRRLPKILQVCGGAKPSGSGLNPCFLWDNPTYLLGYKPDDPKPERTLEAFASSRNYHLSLEKEIDHPAYSAVCRFLENWNPQEAQNYPELVDNGTGFFVFRISGEQRYVHQIPEIIQWWNRQLETIDPKNNQTGFCLVTGGVHKLARLHEPKIKGVRSAQSSGAALVSFNDDAYESFGKTQAFNSPVSERAAFQYCTALNYLLARENKRSLTIGDATVVYWTESFTPVEDIFSMFLDPYPHAEDESTRNQLKGYLEMIRQGHYPGEQFGDDETPFYVLGLSPNAARLSVRFWYVSTVGEMLDHLRQHMLDLEIMDYENDSIISHLNPHQIVDETVTVNPKNGFPDHSRASPFLTGAINRSILTADDYPHQLMISILARIRLEGWIDLEKRKDFRNGIVHRASILKACVNRSIRNNTNFNKDYSMSVSLNKLHPSKAYHCGRLLAVLSFIQFLALGKRNSGVVRKYIASVSVTPGLHLGRLQAQAEIGHIPKIKSPRTAQYIRDELKQINSKVIDEFPIRLRPIEQSMFMLGFYHELETLEKQKYSIKHFHRTNRGEWVRSTGEKHVANALAKMNIEYCYEPNAVLNKGENRIPDFIIPNMINENTIYIEFLGMQNDVEYNMRWDSKYQSYLESGITEKKGPRGQLIIIDARNETLDETQIISFLKNALLLEVD